jgi:arylsulfatase A-like enzyme
MFGVAAETQRPASGRVVARRVEDGEVLLDRQFETNGRDSGWQDVTLDLRGTSGELEIRLDEGAGALAVSEPAFLRSTAENRPQNLILISLDTVRADMLGAYGYERWPTSPHFDSLAAQGTLFEDHISASPWTKPSHLAMLTGVTPEAPGMGELMGSTTAYASGLAFSDAALRNLLDGLGELGLLENSIVIITSDHGDGFDVPPRQMVGIRSDGFKYILTLEKDGRRREQLFDLSADPMERVDVPASYGGVTARLRAKLLSALERNRRRAEEDPGELLEFDARMRQQLEALGYIE